MQLQLIKGISFFNPGCKPVGLKRHQDDPKNFTFEN